MPPIKIVLADTDNDFRCALSSRIQLEKDFELVFSTDSGVEILEYLKTDPAVDLLILNHILYQLDGLAVIEQLSHRDSNKPLILLLSDFLHSNLIRLASDLGTDYFLSKSHSFDFMMDRLHQITERSADCYDNQVASLNIRITSILLALGTPVHIKGYQYLREAILIAVLTPDIMKAVTKELYPEVASRCGTTSSRVERAIRHAIEATWQRGDPVLLRQQFISVLRSSRTSSDGRPTNSAFIAVVSKLVSPQIA